MNDPRLVSIHLDGVRLNHFRQARELLFKQLGEQTLCCIQQDSEEKDPNNHRPSLARKPTPSFWLRDDFDCVYPLKVGINTLGRSSDNDVVIPDCHVSRRHCALVVHLNRQVELHDIASKNGTTLNGERLERSRGIANGDEIRVCGKRLVFYCSDPSRVPDDKTLVGSH